MADAYDVVVIGGGIAGISAAFAVAQRGQQVAVVERESTLTAHSTGRSAAQFLASYGEATNRRLSAASREFLDSDADGLADSAVLIPRNVLWVAPAGLEDRLVERVEANQVTETECELIDAARTIEICPALDPDWLAGGVIEYGGFDIDVAGLHQAYVRGARERGVTILRDRNVRNLINKRSGWHVDTAEGSLSCDVVVNAAGAWADEVAKLAGAETVGMRPLRRTVFTFSTGFDPRADDFVWCAGQGGTGIQTAPAIGRLVAALISDEVLPEELASLTPAVSPERFMH